MLKMKKRNKRFCIANDMDEIIRMITLNKSEFRDPKIQKVKKISDLPILNLHKISVLVLVLSSFSYLRKSKVFRSHPFSINMNGSELTENRISKR